MAQPREAMAGVSQHHRRAIAVRYVRTMENGMSQKAICIGDDMTFSALHVLACIIAPHGATFGRFDASAFFFTCCQNPGSQHELKQYLQHSELAA
jgi:hypothetical protein